MADESTQVASAGGSCLQSTGVPRAFRALPPLTRLLLYVSILLTTITMPQAPSRAEEDAESALDEYNELRYGGAYDSAISPRLLERVDRALATGWPRSAPYVRSTPFVRRLRASGWRGTASTLAEWAVPRRHLLEDLRHEVDAVLYALTLCGLDDYASATASTACSDRNRGHRERQLVETVRRIGGADPEAEMANRQQLLRRLAALTNYRRWTPTLQAEAGEVFWSVLAVEPATSRDWSHPQQLLRGFLAQALATFEARSTYQERIIRKTVSLADERSIDAADGFLRICTPMFWGGIEHDLFLDIVALVKHVPAPLRVTLVTLYEHGPEPLRTDSLIAVVETYPDGREALLAALILQDILGITELDVLKEVKSAAWWREAVSRRRGPR